MFIVCSTKTPTNPTTATITSPAGVSQMFPLKLADRKVIKCTCGNYFNVIINFTIFIDFQVDTNSAESFSYWLITGSYSTANHDSAAISTISQSTPISNESHASTTAASWKSGYEVKIKCLKESLRKINF